LDTGSFAFSSRILKYVDGQTVLPWMVQITYEGLAVMFLSLAPIGEVRQIKAIWLAKDMQDYLKDFGITVDSKVCLALKAYDDAYVINVKNRRIVIGEELARKIIV
jgi:Fe2+ transport system protein FeoA